MAEKIEVIEISPLPGENEFHVPSGVRVEAPIEIPLEERGGLLGMPDFVPCRVGGQVHCSYDDVEGVTQYGYDLVMEEEQPSMEDVEETDPDLIEANAEIFRLRKQVRKLEEQIAQHDRIVVSLKTDNLAIQAKASEILSAQSGEISDLREAMFTMIDGILIETSPSVCTERARTFVLRNSSDESYIDAEGDYFSNKVARLLMGEDS